MQALSALEGHRDSLRNENIRDGFSETLVQLYVEIGEIKKALSWMRNAQRPRNRTRLWRSFSESLTRAHSPPSWQTLDELRVRLKAVENPKSRSLALVDLALSAASLGRLPSAQAILLEAFRAHEELSAESFTPRDRYWNLDKLVTKSAPVGGLVDLGVLERLLSAVGTIGNSRSQSEMLIKMADLTARCKDPDRIGTLVREQAWSDDVKHGFITAWQDALVAHSNPAGRSAEWKTAFRHSLACSPFEPTVGFRGVQSFLEGLLKDGDRAAFYDVLRACPQLELAFLLGNESLRD